MSAPRRFPEHLPIDIRVLAAGDDDVLARVADGVFDNAINPTLANEFLADDRHHVIVALDAGVVVGMITAVDYIHPDKPRELWINEVGVAPSHQRRGIGRQLLDAMLKHGRGIGCSEAWLGTEPHNTAARALYVAGGGEAEEIIMYSFDLGAATSL